MLLHGRLFGCLYFGLKPFDLRPPARDGKQRAVLACTDNFATKILAGLNRKDQGEFQMCFASLVNSMKLKLLESAKAHHLP